MAHHPRRDSKGNEGWRFRDALARGPWHWRDGEVERRLPQGHVTRPPPRIGTVPLVTATGERGDLWCLSVDARSDDPAGLQFSAGAAAAWKAAHAAVRSGLPVLWRALRDLPTDAPPAFHLAAAAPTEASGLHSRPAVVNGHSFGGAFVLALASRVYRLPPAPDVVASVTVTADGALGAVDGLAAKARVVAETAPGLRRFIVHARQQDELKRHLAALGIEHIQVLGVDGLAQLLNHGLTGLETLELFDAGQQEEVADSLFDVARSTDSRVLLWGPVEQAAARLSSTQALPDDAGRQVLFAQMVARRHRGNRAVEESHLARVDDDGWHDRLRGAVRIDVVAHLLQQHVDTGMPSLERCAALFERHAVKPHDAHPAHLKMFGAWGRVLAAHTRFDEALQLQREAARGWLALRHSHEASYPLSEWYRLVPLTAHPAAALDEVEGVVAEAERRGVPLTNGPFVRMARARARRRVQGAVDDVVQELQALAALTEPRELPPRALRELVACGGHVEATARQRLIDGGDAWALQQRLVQLDDAVRASDHEAASSLVAKLAALPSSQRIVAAMVRKGRSPAQVAAEFQY